MVVDYKMDYDSRDVISQEHMGALGGAHKLTHIVPMLRSPQPSVTARLCLGSLLVLCRTCMRAVVKCAVGCEKGVEDGDGASSRISFELFHVCSGDGQMQ